MEYKLILGDCLHKIKELEDNSVDSIVTDPPYGISFMGKNWDYDVPSVDIWKECLRVLKPGGHLLSFSSPRTYHRMAVNVEDAGFEIRDQIMWVYGVGFPKSLNVGKAIDKRGGNNLLALEISKKLKEARTSRNITLKEADEIFCNGSTNYSWFEGRPKGIRIPEPEEFKKIVETWPEMQEYYDKTFPAHRNVLETKIDNGKRTVAILGQEENIYTVSEASTTEAKQWDGWGTALKPAHEPIVLARKPFRGDVASNVLEHGTGALNIDGCRVGEDEISVHNAPKGTFAGGEDGRGSDTNSYKTHVGRWPANFIHDGLEEEWSKYFYCPKASKKDRNEGCEELEEKQYSSDGRNVIADFPKMRMSNTATNHHPTVKPTELMRYLCRLITPKNGTVLDPFMGSGSTGKAAILEGFSFIGVELSEEYLEIAKNRIKLSLLFINAKNKTS
jgi:DNA modification methylase